MDWQTFIQWFFIVASGASIFGAWLAWASRKNGKETRELMKELHLQSQQQHQDIVELLKKGFGEVLQRMAI